MLQPRKRLSGSGGLMGGGSAATPTTTPDTLRSNDTVEIVLGLGEGPIEGLRNGYQDLFMGATAVAQANGTPNFQDFTANFFPGEDNAAPLTFQLGGAADNHAVGVTLTNNTPVVRQTQSGAIDFIQVRLIVAALYKQVIGGNSPGLFTDSYQFRIRYKPVGSSDSSWTVWTDSPYLNSPSNPYYTGYNQYASEFNATNYQSQVAWAIAQQAGQGNGYITISGKTTAQYVKEYKIPVQRTPNGYTIEITQISANSDAADSSANGTYHINNVQWESFQEIDASPKTYDNTAIMQIVAKATDQFSSIPQISGVYRGLVVRVPTNYDPTTRTYTGTWNGTWQYAWTNNPAWLLYEAISNTRWGWSAYTPVNWSQYEAYELAQYCDTMIPNPLNNNALVPRYTFNCIITDPMDGRDFCRYIAGSFFSVITDDNNGNVHVLMDKNDDAIALVGKESIIGDFAYTYTDVTTRYNDITAVFQNPDINFAQDRRRVYNQDSIDQFGRIPYNFVSVGTTNEWEAIRKATRRLVQANTETEMVTFTTNRVAQFWAPYDVILVADTDKAQGYSGRFTNLITNSSGQVTGGYLRQPIYIEAGVTYQIIVQDKNLIWTANLTNTAGSATQLTWDTPLPSSININAQFALSQDGDYGIPKPYRIISNSNGDGPDNWTIVAIEINRNKFSAEDTATQVGEPQYIFTQQRVPADPQNVFITNTSHLGVDGTYYTQFRIDFTAPDDPYVTDFRVRFRLVGESEWEVQEIPGSGYFIDTQYAGEYEAQVQTENVWQQFSSWVAAEDTVTTTKSTDPTGGAILSVVGGLNEITINGIYPNEADIRYMQVWRATTDDQTKAVMLGKTDGIVYIDTGITGVQSFYYWVKFEDNQGNVGDFAEVHGVLGTSTQVQPADLSSAAVTAAQTITDPTTNEPRSIQDVIADLNATASNLVSRASSLEDSLNAAANNIEDLSQGFLASTINLQTERDNRISNDYKLQVVVYGDGTANNPGVLASLERIDTVVGDETTGLVESVNNLTVQVGSNSANIYQTQKVVGDKNSGLVQETNAMSLTIYGDGTANNPGMSATLNQLNEIVGNSSYGLVQEVNNLSVAIGDGSSGVTSSLSQLQQVVGDQNSGLVKETNDLSVAINGSNGNPGVVAKLSSLSQVVGDQNSGLVQQTNNLSVAINGSNGNPGVVSSLSSLKQVVGDTNSGLVKQTNNLQVLVSGDGTSANPGMAASLQTVQQVVANQSSALSQYSLLATAGNVVTGLVILAQDGTTHQSSIQLQGEDITIGGGAYPLLDVNSTTGLVSIHGNLALDGNALILGSIDTNKIGSNQITLTHSYEDQTTQSLGARNSTPITVLTYVTPTPLSGSPINIDANVGITNTSSNHDQNVTFNLYADGNLLKTWKGRVAQNSAAINGGSQEEKGTFLKWPRDTNTAPLSAGNHTFTITAQLIAGTDNETSKYLAEIRVTDLKTEVSAS